jgi:colanic acid biosynthesis glycosyl transferase WcaI
MRIQLWSYNYAPEPTGIAPISTVWAQAMRARRPLG